MPIQTEDIKLLKSAVMADVPEGGGAMTGIAVLDGQSNNLMPDTSAMDRALGVVNAIKLFAVAHSDDTDTLMGAHAIVTDAPDDALVHCTLMRASQWAETRNAAQDNIEKYLVKGPRHTFRLWETHYTGSLLVRLISMVDGVPPAGGDAIVLRNPDGVEEYLRILRVSTITQQVAVVEGGGTVLIDAKVATCEIGNPLEHDFFGPPALRVGLDDDLFAQTFTTNTAAGARFYGIKPLAFDGSIGDYSVVASGGIYSPVVPAATVESPLVDLYPLTSRAALSRTARASVMLPAVDVDLIPGVVLRTPTPIEPGSVLLEQGATVFTDDGSGALKLGADTVGSVDYAGKSIQITQGSYGYATHSLSYRPATPAGASLHSVGVPITSVNQGRVFVQAFQPPPAPGTLGVSFMAQNRWYDLTDNANGKLAGGDPTHGIGTVDYITGSNAVTLGAIPDVGSTLIYQWGDSAAAEKIADPLPTRLAALLDFPHGAKPGTLVLKWVSGGVPYEAICGADGNLSGDATGKVVAKYKSSGGGYQYVNEVTFEPAYIPDGAIAATWATTPASSYQITSNGSGSYTLDQLPVAPGSVSFSVSVKPVPNIDSPSALYVVDNGLGVLYATNNGFAVVGSIDYATGAMQINATAALAVYEYVVESYEGNFNGYYTRKAYHTNFTMSLFQHSVSSPAHRRDGDGPPGAGSAPRPTAWQMSFPVAAGLSMRTTGFIATVAGVVYFSTSGVVARGWDALTSSSLKANAGVLLPSGLLSIEPPPSGSENTVVVANAALDKTIGMTVGQGIFRVASTPLKVGVFQIQAGPNIGVANDAGDISGGGFRGTVDFKRGIVTWSRIPFAYSGAYPWADYVLNSPIEARELSYNAVFLQYLPLDKTLLGIDTVRLPLDGRVPIYRTGDLVVVHNTLTTQLPNPVVKGTAYLLGRTRLASLRVKDALGVLVPSGLYVSELTPGNISIKAGSDIAAFVQPLTVEHRIEDLLLCSQADISGEVKFTRALTHAFPAANSFVSSALPFGNLFARPHTYIEQETWSGEWSDELIGAAPLSNFNEGQFPIVVTNRGTIAERWALIFTSSTAFRIIGESVGIIGTGSTGAPCAPINPATGVPYFTLPEGGWGAGWSVGNVLRFNTAACGVPFWVVRTVLQGPSSLDSDKFAIAFRGDVDRP